MSGFLESTNDDQEIWYENQTAAARSIGLGQATISEWIAAGRLPSVKVPTGHGPPRNRIRRSDLLRAAGIDPDDEILITEEQLAKTLETAPKKKREAFDVLVQSGGYNRLDAAKILNLTTHRTYLVKPKLSDERQSRWEIGG